MNVERMFLIYLYHQLERDAELNRKEHLYRRAHPDDRKLKQITSWWDQYQFAAEQDMIAAQIGFFLTASVPPDDKVADDKKISVASRRI